MSLTLPTDCRQQGRIVDKRQVKKGVKVVSGRIQALAAEMEEVVRSIAERELK